MTGGRMGIPLRAILRELNRRNISFAVDSAKLAKLMEWKKNIEKFRNALYYLEDKADRMKANFTPELAKKFAREISGFGSKFPFTDKPHDFRVDDGIKRITKRLNQNFDSHAAVREGIEVALSGLRSREKELEKLIQQER